MTVRGRPRPPRPRRVRAARIRLGRDVAVRAWTRSRGASRACWAGASPRSRSSSRSSPASPPACRATSTPPSARSSWPGSTSAARCSAARRASRSDPCARRSVEYSGIVSASGAEEAAEDLRSDEGARRDPREGQGRRRTRPRISRCSPPCARRWERQPACASTPTPPGTPRPRSRACATSSASGCEGCEQPCAADDFEGLAWLTARSPVPVIADESLVSLRGCRAPDRARAPATSSTCASRSAAACSGAGRIRDLGREAGIDTMLGAHVGETAILAAAGRHFATRTPELRFAEGSYGKLLLRADVSDAMDLGPGGWGPAIARRRPRPRRRSRGASRRTSSRPWSFRHECLDQPVDELAANRRCRIP